jgi:hypothetical protein
VAGGTAVARARTGMTAAFIARERGRGGPAFAVKGARCVGENWTGTAHGNAGRHERQRGTWRARTTRCLGLIPSTGRAASGRRTASGCDRWARTPKTVRAGTRSARCRIPTLVQFSVPWFD